jgi:hypothetical protein
MIAPSVIWLATFTVVHLHLKCVNDKIVLVHRHWSASFGRWKFLPDDYLYEYSALWEKCAGT